ncbi:hypothetical protein BS17DRAFT_791139 [Gyrodon lividus]|nr:hypothetical protein BS17DRAFT_791139 [Gyrodon lividus]
MSTRITGSRYKHIKSIPSRYRSDNEKTLDKQRRSGKHHPSPHDLPSATKIIALVD